MSAFFKALFNQFNPEGFISRLLGMGDLEALLEKAREWVKNEKVSIEEILFDSLYERARTRAIERVKQAFEKGIISNAALLNEIDCMMEIFSYPIARMIVVAIDNDYLLRRYALAEAKKAYEGLKEEEFEFIQMIAKEFDINFTLEPKIVRLHGVVISSKPDDIVDVQIDAISNYGEFSAFTDENGEYIFDELPIGVNAGDTTTYNLSINGKGISQIIRIPASLVNTIVEAQDFLLPSGKIKLLITDCSQPLEGIGVTIIKPDGTTITKTTNENKRQL